MAEEPTPEVEVPPSPASSWRLVNLALALLLVGCLTAVVIKGTHHQPPAPAKTALKAEAVPAATAQTAVPPGKLVTMRDLQKPKTGFFQKLCAEPPPKTTAPPVKKKPG